MATSRRTVTDKRPNILFIMTDQQFAEVMSCRMGREDIDTPAMDNLAAGGMLFTRAYSPNPLCLPARCSIFTGLYPHQTGIQENRFETRRGPEDFACMGNYFADAGYDTGYFGKWHLFYDVEDRKAHGFNSMGALHDNGHDDEIPGPAIDFMKTKRDKPFLLIVSLSNPHDVCQWSRFQELPSGPIPDPQPVDQLPPLRDNSAPPENETDTMALMRKSYHNNMDLFPLGDYDEDKWRRLIWGYYRIVEKVDALIGRVLSALRESGQEETTLVIFTSDHGDCHGAHKFNQKTVFYDESTRVPFVMSYKGKIGKGTTDKLVNAGIDVMPTLFDYAGIDRPDKLPGRSLRDIAEDREPSSWRDYVVVQNFMTQGGPVDGVTPQINGRMVRSRRYKYCLYDRGRRRESLAAIEEDTGETVNIVDDPSCRSIVDQHRGYLREHSIRYNDIMALEMLEGLGTEM